MWNSGTPSRRWCIAHAGASPEKPAARPRGARSGLLVWLLQKWWQTKISSTTVGDIHENAAPPACPAFALRHAERHPGRTVWAHGDVTPQAVDTKSLPQLGDDWRPDNPYRAGTEQQEAQRIGSSAYNQNCARCHGLEAVSGGIAPDLRKLDSDCVSLADAKKKQACMTEISQYFTTTVRKGRTRDGRVYMPPVRRRAEPGSGVGDQDLPGIAARVRHQKSRRPSISSIFVVFRVQERLHVTDALSACCRADQQQPGAGCAALAGGRRAARRSAGAGGPGQNPPERHAEGRCLQGLATVLGGCGHPVCRHRCNAGQSVGHRVGFASVAVAVRCRR